MDILVLLFLFLVIPFGWVLVDWIVGRKLKRLKIEERIAKLERTQDGHGKAIKEIGLRSFLY